MLFTRCPDCETTFRVTDEALKKANGQVRCGRCASVFNAYAELHDPDAPKGARQPAAAPADAPPAPPPAGPKPAAEAPPPPTPPRPPAETEASDVVATGIGAASVADVVHEIEIGTTEAAAVEAASAPREPEPSGAATGDAISAKEVDEVLTTADDVERQSAPIWIVGATERRPVSRWWSAAAALAVLALGLQVVNHFRASLAGHDVVGPWIQRAYAAIGTTVTPRWDVGQYTILDWVATAEPNSRGLGSLKIAARIQNRGPARQPYPAVRLRLKDRFETTVGSRTFEPAEYLPRDTPRGRLMSAGETARAEIEVVDPGPDAYGFELDVCIEVEARALSCGTDEVFL